MKGTRSALPAYNALGHRAQWAYGSAGAADQHLFDPAGNWLGVWWSYDLVRFGDRHMLVYFGNDTLFNHVNDLGSTSVMTNHAGTAAEDMLFSPWGGVWQSWGGGGYNFAEMPYNDVKTTTDVTTARHFSPNFGRWFSPDPIGKSAVRLDDPQTWNMYAYVRNNPTTLTDPSGLNACGTSDDTKCKVTVTFASRTTDKDGNYNDQFTDVKNQEQYNATATVSVNGKVAGTFLANTLPSNTGDYPTVANGTYEAAFTMHNDVPAIRLQPTAHIPITDSWNPATGLLDASGILVHPAGENNGTGTYWSVRDQRVRGVSEGCLLVCTTQYTSFSTATGLTPADASPPQTHFTVILGTVENTPPE